MARETMVTRYYSAHIYRNSPYESDDNCGTCDGASCDVCCEMWRVEGWNTNDEKDSTGRSFNSKEEAQAYAENWERGEES